MLILEIFAVAYILISYLTVGYVVTTDKQPYTTLNIGLFVISPITLIILIAVAIKLWHNDKKLRENQILEEEIN